MSILGLPSKARGKYQKRKLLTDEQKSKILRARNRDNARRTRKRKKLYVNFIDKALKALEAALGISSTSSSANSSSKLDEENYRSDGENDDARMTVGPEVEDVTKMKSESHLSLEEFEGETPIDYQGEISRFDATYPSTTVGTSSDLPPTFSSPSYLDMIGRQLEGNHIYTAVASRNVLNSMSNIDSGTIAIRDDEEQMDRNFTGKSSAQLCLLNSKDTLIAKRLRYVKGYLKLRHTSVPELVERDLSNVVSEWLNVCSGEVVHVTPLPAYRNAKDLTAISSSPIECLDCTYECRGINAVAMDSVRIAHYFDVLEMGACCTAFDSYESRGEGLGEGQKEGQIERCKSDLRESRRKQRLWRAVCNMDCSSAYLCGEENDLCVSYVLTVELADRSASVIIPSSSASSASSPICGKDCASASMEKSFQLGGGNTLTDCSAVDLDENCHPSNPPLLVVMNCENENRNIVRSECDKVANPTCNSDCDARIGMEVNGEEERDEDEDEEIVRWIAMALDTTHIRHSRQKRHLEDNYRRKKREQERYSAAQWDGTESDDSESYGTYAMGQLMKRKKKRKSEVSDSDGSATEIFLFGSCISDSKGIVAGTHAGDEEYRDKNSDRIKEGGEEEDGSSSSAGIVLLRLRVTAVVKFGGVGSDSYGRILRISEKFAAHEDNIYHRPLTTAVTADEGSRAVVMIPDMCHYGRYAANDDAGDAHCQ